jgi:hypothetical protein
VSAHCCRVSKVTRYNKAEFPYEFLSEDAVANGGSLIVRYTPPWSRESHTGVTTGDRGGGYRKVRRGGDEERRELCYDMPHSEAMPFAVAMPEKTPGALSEDWSQEKLLENPFVERLRRNMCLLEACIQEKRPLKPL